MPSTACASLHLPYLPDMQIARFEPQTRKRVSMLFKPELCAFILEGKKTQTRRMCRDGEVLIGAGGKGTRPVTDGDRGIGVYTARGCRYGVAKSYALQPGRGKRAVGRVTITAIRYCARAADISEDDARAEGFATVDDFRATYARLNGAGALDRPCWTLTFAIV
jgi:hypothetical protein